MSPMPPAPLAAQPANNTTTTTTTHNQDAKVQRRPRREKLRVSLACTHCRKRKRKCNGKLPTCDSCTSQRLECVFDQDPNTTGPPFEVLTFRLLNSNPAAAPVHPVQPIEAMQTVQTMQPPSEVDSMAQRSVAMSGVKQEPESPSGVEWRPGPPPVYVPRQFEIKHPKLYPHLTPIDVEILPSPLYRVAKSPEGLPFNRPVLDKVPRPFVPYVWKEPVLSLASDLYDPRLQYINIGYWTTVPISNELARQALSLYFRVDHPLIGPFYDEFFIGDLVSLTTDHCSSLLVNALMFWVCQIYAGIADEARHLVVPFRDEAERLLSSELSAAFTLDLAAAQFLSLGYLAQGNQDEAVKYMQLVATRAVSCSLFGSTRVVPEDEVNTKQFKATTYTAWGLFNYVMLMTLFYFPPNFPCQLTRPRFPVPRGTPKTPDYVLEPGHIMLPVSQTFTAACQFWTIMHQVVLNGDLDPAVPAEWQKVLRTSEWKFRKLLTWADNLPPGLLRSRECSNHVMVFHMWLHAAIMNVFEPFIDFKFPGIEFKSFPTPMGSPQQAYEASANQLRRLVIVYRMNYDASSYTFLWHTALTYVANSIVKDHGGHESSYYFRLCLYGYKSFHTSYPVVNHIIKAVLNLGIRRGYLDQWQATRLWCRLNKNIESPGNSENVTDSPTATTHQPPAAEDTIVEEVEPPSPMEQSPRRLNKQVARATVYDEDEYSDEEDEEDAWLELLISEGL